MQGTHDLGRTPSLIDTQVADNVRCLKATIETGDGDSEEGTWRQCTTAIGDLRLARRFSCD